MSLLLRATRPVRSVMSKRRLIVTEEGARGLDAFLSADESDETMVVAQGVVEAAAELPFRVMGRLALIERSGRAINQAVILVGPRVDGESLAVRELVVRAVLTHMAAAGGGELTLAACEAEADLQHDLLTLVETLLGEHEKTVVTFRLRFHGNESAPVSQVRAARRPVQVLAS